MSVQPGESRRHRVVVIGSGFGGLFGTQALRRADVEVTLIGRTTHHLFQPLLYQVATGILSVGDIAPATRMVLRKQKNAQVLLGEVETIDLEKKTVTSRFLERQTVTEFDSLIVAAGAGPSYFGNDHFAEFAPGMKTIDDALELRGRILGAFEQAELSDDHDERSRLLTFVVVGAGPTGVELAGQIAELSRRTLKDAFRHIDSTEARVVLLDGASEVLPVYGGKLSRKTRKTLERLGVEIQLNAMVTGVDAEGLTVKEKDGTERRLESQCKVWSAGVAASPLGKQLAEQSGAGIDRAGRVEVLPDLSLPGYPNVFVIGDMMSLDKLPGLAQVAMQGGKYAARQIISSIEGQDPAQRPPFKYFDKGSMATISRFSAVAKVGKLEISGFLGWIAWLFIHLLYLVGFSSKLSTLLSWTQAFFSSGRNEMAATEQQVFARIAIERLRAHTDGELTPGADGSGADGSAANGAGANTAPAADRKTAG
ncbi:NAD(P)/FAD-dependent oxidoreductase [Rhodococcus chondri]|uniref:NADH:ubiquinone reductase (non-electrogenic) n=1 Tax=Rhodococcus chondri TaxID=3065941 RepID=A0ABU7JYW7_9NOCA|nr:NAD(P)/FAD-dependent oxidoreductase [Rhodococcus sp. CC-R104]MEE2035208.1 NAD(P)/FAD-dependent oxidoreductase [Rhodococcus sp. CC-R104]